MTNDQWLKMIDDDLMVARMEGLAPRMYQLLCDLGSTPMPPDLAARLVSIIYAVNAIDPQGLPSQSINQIANSK